VTTFLQTTDGDLSVTGGKFSLVTDPATAGAQKLRNQFKLFLGEWFLDTRVGVPYFAAALGVKPNIAILEQLFGNIIRKTKGVKALNSITITFDRAKRALSVAFQAVWDTGAVITFTDLDKPFVVNVATNQGLGSS
jgi:hypothetical protein